MTGVAANGTARVDSWTPVDLNTLPDKPPIKPELGGLNLVYPGKRHVFSGPPESAKTLAAYCVLIQVARAGDPAILIDFEMGPYDARQRLRELGAAADEISRVLYLEPDEPATDTRIGLLVAARPKLVVVDAAVGAYQLEGLDDNKRADVEQLSRLYVTTFWREGIATVLVDHVGKDTESRGHWTIGSERKLGGADVHLGFDAITPVSRGSAGKYKITTHKDRGGYLRRGHVADLELESDPDTHAIAWRFAEAPDPAAFRPMHVMEKVSRRLEGEPSTRKELVPLVGGRREVALRAIAQLIREHFVAEEQDGRRNILRSVRPYREDDPACNPEESVGATIIDSRDHDAGDAEQPEPRPTGWATDFEQLEQEAFGT